MNTDAQLASLDPALTPKDLDVSHDAVAQAVLARITASPQEVDGVIPLKPAARRTGARRAVLAACSVAAVGGLAVAAPSLLGGPTPAHAWTPVGSSLPTSEAEAAEEACLEGFWGFLPGRQGPDLETYVAEQRGSWTLVYSSDEQAMTEQVCLLRDGSPVGAAGQAPGPEAADPTSVAANDAHGSIGGLFSTATESLRFSTGVVGDDVVGVVLHTEAQGAVTATISQGHFAAWWPDRPVTETSENADTTPSFDRVTLALRDGTTRQLGVDEFTGLSLESLTTPDSGGSAG